MAGSEGLGVVMVWVDGRYEVREFERMNVQGSVGRLLERCVLVTE